MQVGKLTFLTAYKWGVGCLPLSSAAELRVLSWSSRQCFELLGDQIACIHLDGLEIGQKQKQNGRNTHHSPTCCLQKREDREKWASSPW